MRHGPAIGVGLVGDTLWRPDRVPKLLASRVPKLAEQAGPGALDGVCRTLEPIFVLLGIAGDDRAMCERRRINRDDLADNRAGTALGTLGEEIGPAIGDPVARPIIGERR